jgi:hypothetical protein
VPDTGSIYGGGEVRIFGNFERSAIATIGGIRTVQGWSPTDPTVRILHAPPHAAGPVDVIVTNPDGRSQTVVGGYTYVEPESFDLNGEWDAVTVDGSDTFLQFTVRARVLTRVRCENSFYQTVEMTLSVPVLNGRAEFSGDAGNFSAWVASASQAAGTIDMPPCSGGLRWQAARTRP